MGHLTRREALAAAIASPLAVGVAAGADQSLAPDQAGRLADGATVTVRFTVARVLSVGDAGDIWLLNYMSSQLWTGATRVAFRVVLTEAGRHEFRRIGVTDLRLHFQGRSVTVRGTVRSYYATGPLIQRGTLMVDALGQFVSVQ